MVALQGPSLEKSHSRPPGKPCKRPQIAPEIAQGVSRGAFSGPDQGLAPESAKADNPAMLKFWLLAIPALLAGCADSDRPSAEARKAHTEKRQARAEVALSKTPVPRTYPVQGNQMQVIEVPTADKYGYVEMTRCFVWRDAEFKTATMSCPQQTDILIPE
jgi:hypothetical protein